MRPAWGKPRYRAKNDGGGERSPSPIISDALYRLHASMPTLSPRVHRRHPAPRSRCLQLGRTLSSPQDRGARFSTVIGTQIAAPFLQVTACRCRPLFACFIAKLASRHVAHAEQMRSSTSGYLTHCARRCPATAGPKGATKYPENMPQGALARSPGASRRRPPAARPARRARPSPRAS